MKRKKQRQRGRPAVGTVDIRGDGGAGVSEAPPKNELPEIVRMAYVGEQTAIEKLAWGIAFGLDSVEIVELAVGDAFERGAR